jgi:sulfite reductase beta subunit-like hemoprotein
MMIRSVLLCLLTSSVAGCTHDVELMRLEETLSSFGSAVRWSQFERASDFQTAKARRPVDPEALKDIHVTAYDVVYRHESEGRKSVKQTAEIRYFVEQVGVEKKLVDRQSWTFDEEKNQWFLDSPLPVFQR